ncbi:MAG: ATP-binding protein [Bellilinea sp.]
MKQAAAVTAVSRFFATTPLHIGFWLLVKPSAWRKALDQIDLTLPTEFSCLTLTPEQRRNPVLVQFLLNNYLLLVMFNVAAVAIILSLAKVSQPVLFQSLWLTLGYSLIIPPVMSLKSSVSSAYLLGGTIALGIGLLARRTDYFYIPIALAGGLTGNVLLNQARRTTKRFNSRELAGLLTGILAAVLLIFIGLNITSGDVFGVYTGAPGALPLPARFAWIITTSAGILYMLIELFVLKSHTNKRLIDVLPIAALEGLVIGVCYYLFFISIENTPVFLISAGFGGGMLMCFLFTATWQLANQVGGPQAGAMAASLVLGISWVYLSQDLVMGYTFEQINIVRALLVTLAGLTFSVWRPIVSLPFIAIWNNLLYTLDSRSNVSPLKYFKLHAAFFEEGQSLVWPGLADYLILQAERDPEGFVKSKLKFSDSPQRLALQAAEIELLARKLESCADLASISGASRLVQWNFSDSQISILLSPFARMSHDVESALNQSSIYQTRLGLGRVRDDLNLFQRELILSPQPNSGRFTRVTAAWDRIIENKIERLTREANYHLEIANPYICGMPLNDQQEVFVGRTDIMARLESLLLGPNRPPLHLYGQRRMGKTSLLLNLGHYLPSTIISVFLDGQGLAGYSQRMDLFFYMVNEIRSEAYRQRGLKLPAIIRQENKSLFAQISRWIDQSEKILVEDDAIVLLMMDEFEALEPILQNNKSQIQEYLGLARFTIQHRPHFKLLFVGSHTLDEIDAWSTFLFNAQVVKMGRLAPSETMRLIENPVKNFQLTYVPPASQHILYLTRGHPHLVQSICYELVMLKNEQPSNQRFLVTMADVEEAANRTLTSNSFFFVDVRGPQINPQTTAMLDHLANLGPEGSISRDEWARCFPENFKANLALALKRDLVEEENGFYHFQVEMIRRWFAYRPF